MNKLIKKKKKGFTLIELIAVVAILAVLAVIAVPRVIQYVEKSKRVAIQTEATTIYNAAQAAYNDGSLKVNNTVPKDFNNVTVESVLNNNPKIIGNEKADKLTKSLTMTKLEDIMNTNQANIEVGSNGEFAGIKN